MNRDWKSIKYIGITADGICRQSASSGSIVSTFNDNIKQAKVSEISIWYA